MGLGSSNSQRGPWAPGCPTACNDSKRVTAGPSAVSEEVAWQRPGFVKAGWTAGQERGMALWQPRGSTRQPPACWDGRTYPARERGEGFGSPQDLGLRRQKKNQVTHTQPGVHLPHPAESTPQLPVLGFSRAEQSAPRSQGDGGLCWDHQSERAQGPPAPAGTRAPPQGLLSGCSPYGEGRACLGARRQLGQWQTLGSGPQEGIRGALRSVTVHRMEG